MKHDTSTYKGIQMKDIKGDPTNRFITMFPCVECNTKSKGLEKHKQHMLTQHDGIEYKLNCVFSECEYSTRNPKIMMKHLGEIHETSMTK